MGRGVEEAGRTLMKSIPSGGGPRDGCWGMRGPPSSPLAARYARSPWSPQEGAAGLTGGPWGPGGPGVCEEHAQAEGKAGQVSPSFWEKGDPHH